MDTCVELPTYEVALGGGIKILFPLQLDGVTSPIAGWMPTLVVTESLTDTSIAPLATLTLGDGLSVYDADNWLADVLAGYLAAAELKTYHYAMRAVDPDGQLQTLEIGFVKFTPAGPPT